MNCKHTGKKIVSPLDLPDPNNSGLVEPDVRTDADLNNLLLQAQTLKESADRNLAACLIDKIIAKDRIKKLFNEYMHQEFAQIRDSDGTLRYDEFLLFCDPEQIGKAVISAISQSSQK